MDDGAAHVSGSAYKIVNKRAYHHGTMLISTRLETLGDLLRVNKVRLSLRTRKGIGELILDLQETMVTKGVASVRSPVCNLQAHSSDITHDKFVRTVELAFREEYDIDVDEPVGLPAKRTNQPLLIFFLLRCITCGRTHLLSALKIFRREWQNSLCVSRYCRQV